MKYFLDTEFIEGFKKPISWLPTIGNFNKEYHSIQLISIGIVCEDGREYYAISKEYNYKDASDWVKKNVIVPMYRNSLSGDIKNRLSPENFPKHVGKPNKQIAEEIKEFVGHIDTLKYDGYNAEFDGHCYKTTVDSFFIPNSIHAQNPITKDYFLKNFIPTEPEFYAYYADYDWVVFCSLFGTMMDLPEGFPMYCRDLKQNLDETAKLLTSLELSKLAYPTVSHNVYATLDSGVINDRVKCLESAVNYPKQKNEHNALDDAKWNFNLYKFLKNL